MVHPLGAEHSPNWNRMPGALNFSASPHNKSSRSGEANEFGVLDDLKVHVKLKLSALWASLMFCYIYGDYFGLYVPGQLKGMLGGQGPIGPLSQSALVITSILLAVPGIMVFLSLVLPPKVNRWLNVVLGAFYIVVMLLTMPGAWLFYIFLGMVEIAIGALTIWHAWNWPRQTSSS